MTDEQLAGLAADLESEQVERKESLANKDRICQAICAFANDVSNHGRPGSLLVGVTDDGKPSGLLVSDALLRELADLRSNGQLYPFPMMSVEKRTLAGADVAVVTVQPSDFPPVRYEGRVWIRVGPSRRLATPEEERRLAEKRLLRIDGTELADPIKDEKRLDGPLSQLLRSLEELLRLNVSAAVDLSSRDVEVVAPDYPVVALQQYVRNAVMHRTYEGTNSPVRMTWFRDRVEVQSPGGPYGQVTVENFGRPGVTDYRNPTIAEAMKTLGYVQRFGVGLETARRELERNGNPAPTLEPHPENVLVVVGSVA